MVQVTIEIGARARTINDCVNAFESKGGVVVQIRGAGTEFVENADLIAMGSEGDDE